MLKKFLLSLKLRRDAKIKLRIMDYISRNNSQPLDPELIEYYFKYVTGKPSKQEQESEPY